MYKKNPSLTSWGLKNVNTSMPHKMWGLIKGFEAFLTLLKKKSYCEVLKSFLFRITHNKPLFTQNNLQ